ncbi:hypothetical protein RvY_11226 [Ramazzottius varieornatus]|uniref:Uncharacterized protein n=1 Tax=Ramazzottius varieornatus TaxID=947166 RepID=A0A1D1VN64_RAMVA|nr:hypothetical protein RvY_11226 [Ramazzottius varieornatus]
MKKIVQNSFPNQNRCVHKVLLLEIETHNGFPETAFQRQFVLLILKLLDQYCRSLLKKTLTLSERLLSTTFVLLTKRTSRDRAPKNQNYVHGSIATQYSLCLRCAHRYAAV